MMKKLLSMLLALMMAFGCMAFAEEKADYTGSWMLTGAEVGGAPIDLSLIGLTMTMELREDGSCTLTTMGVPEEGSWAETEGGVAVTDSLGETNVFVPAEGKLAAEQDGMKIIFSRAGDMAAFVGVWELTGLESEGVQMGTATMAMFGLTMTMTLKEDGTCVVSAAGQDEVGTWHVTEQGVAITDPTDTIEFVYENDMLITEEDGSKMMLTREGAAPAVAESSEAAVCANVPAEEFEGAWELSTATVFGMELTAEDMGTFIIFELAEGKGIYTEADATGATAQAEITYTVTEVEENGTVLDLLYQDATMEEPVVLLSMNMLDDGRLMCVLNVEGMDVSYYFTEIVETVEAE